MMRGLFITFEGGEGTGKSTQARMLAERLLAERPTSAGGPDVVVTREPGGTVLGERIRGLVLDARPQSAAAEFLLFAAARAEHMAALVLPSLARGAIVICDRFVDSTRVYQGRLAGIDARLMEVVERYTVARMPDATLVLDIDPAEGLARARRRGETNRYDEASLDYHERLREGFLDIARREPGRCTVIDAGRDQAQVADGVWRAVAPRLVRQPAPG